MLLWWSTAFILACKLKIRTISLRTGFKVVQCMVRTKIETNKKPKKLEEFCWIPHSPFASSTCGFEAWANCCIRLQCLSYADYIAIILKQKMWQVFIKQYIYSIILALKTIFEFFCVFRWRLILTHQRIRSRGSEKLWERFHRLDTVRNPRCTHSLIMIFIWFYRNLIN